MAFGKKDRPTVDKDGAALVMRKRDYLADFSGQLGLGLMANLVGQLQYFYTDKVGIAVGSVGIVMAIAKIVDALTDIWFGNIIDHSKGGNMKYYKWMLRMAVPAAAITVLMFTVPISAGQIPAIAYALVTNLLITAVKCLFGNKYWVIVLLFNLITAVSTAIASASGAYYCKWIFGNDNLVAIAGSVGMLSTILGFALSSPIIKKLGIKGTINLGLLGYAATCVVRCVLPTNLVAYIGSGLVGSFLQIPLMCLYGVLLAMAVDYNEYKYDKKLVAVSSGAIGFGSKVGNGLGALILAGFLVLGSYDATLTEATGSMRTAIYAFSNYLPIVLNVGMFLIFRGFDLEEKLPAMRAEVAKRHTQKTEE